MRSPIKRHSPFTSLFVVFNYSWWRRLLVIFPVLVVIGLVVLTMWPNIGAIGAAWLRPLIGNQGVAALETAFFTVQDTVRQWQYRLGLAQPTTPWAIPPPQTPPPVLSIATITPTAPGIVPLPTIPPPIPLQTSATPAPTTTIAPTLTPTPAGWQLMPVPALGSLTGEGQWVAYLYSPAGKVVAYRTFLQPDPERPFALAAVVAFDLAQTHLHFVLGTEEPGLPDGPRGYGRIPESDRQADLLLATFNGGFQTTHGNFGAMADGIVAVPARDGFGTVAFYADGTVLIGAWNEDILPGDDLVAWRQNGRLVVDDGMVNERVFNNSIADWGGTIDGDIVTWRSGLAMSADRQVLYYIAGPSLSMPVLAEVMLQVGAANGILLDINASWVHFTAIQSEGEAGLIAEPLFAEGMETLVDRYLRPHSRDFFYVTLAQP
ncbi:MAG: hypothetical protein KA338_04780 [Chloroflexi bacterium]|nr:hypothetical protein [Chloroflexota bacterium]